MLKHTLIKAVLKYKILLSLLFVLSVFSITYAIDTISSGYRITTTSRTINAHSKCQIVRTTSGSDVFAPTLTSTEWTSFINNKPSNVSLSACPPPCTSWAFSDSSQITSWSTFKYSSSQFHWARGPAQGPTVSGMSYSATSYTTGGYRYERGALVRENGSYGVYYIRRCAV